MYITIKNHLSRHAIFTMTSSISSVQLNQEKGSVTYNKIYSIFPFSFPSYPASKMRFCITIISTPQYIQNSRLLEFICNAFPNFNIVKNCHKLGDALSQISDSTKPVEVLSKQLAIFDLSPDNQFGKIVPDIIPASDDTPFKNLITNQILRILVPNLTFGKEQPTSTDKSYSYTIWIASKLSELPEIIRTNSHVIFMTESEDVTLYTKKYFGMETALIPSEEIFTVCSTLTQDLRLMNLPKSRCALQIR